MSDPTKVGTRTQYTQVVGVKNVRRLPRIGKIRLGIKATTATGTEYPKDVTYFVCPPEVQAVYGEQPRELDVIIPVEDPKHFFPFALKWYSAASLVCKGDGVTADRAKSKVDDKDVVLDATGTRRSKVKCPCGHLKTDENPKGECTLKATLMVMIPKVSMGGIYAIDTGSIHNVIEINSCVAMERQPDPAILGDEGEPGGFLRALFGRVALIPLKLRRVERDIEKPDGKRVKKWLLQLTTDANLPAVQAYRDGAVLALQRSATLALPEPDRDITDDKKPIDVTDLEGVQQSAPDPAEVPPNPIQGEESTHHTIPKDAAPQTEAPPTGRQPGEDEDDGLDHEEDPIEGIRNAIRNVKTLTELDEVWKEKVMKNSGLDGKVKFELQELLLSQKKALKKSK